MEAAKHAAHETRTISWMIVGDGAYGTLLAEHAVDGIVDPLCISQPELVAEAHALFARAGAREIQTCSFMVWSYPAHQQRKLYESAIAVAEHAIRSVGGTQPVPSVTLTVGPSTDVESLRLAISTANNAGLDIVVETVTSSNTLDALEAALDHVPVTGRLWVCASVDPSHPDARSHVHQLITWCADNSAVPGLNCCTGAHSSLSALSQLMVGIPFVRLVPSAGVGTVLAPKEWAAALATMASTLDQPVIAGCCGTTPAHIVALRQLVS